MKVALIVGHFPVASETFVRRQAEGLLQAGVDLTVITFQAGGDMASMSPEFRKRFDGRIRTVRAGKGQTLLRKLLFGRALATAILPGRLGAPGRAMLRALRKGLRWAAVDVAIQSAKGALGRYDAIIAHFGPNGVRAMYLRQAGLIDGPLATVFHGYDMSKHSTLHSHLPGYRELFAETERLLPISDFWARRLVAWGAPPDKVQVLRMGVDLPASGVTPADKPLGRPLRVLSVGRFVEKKGLIYAIEGARRCRTPVELTIIGFGELEPELRRAAEEPGGNPVRFLGPKPHPVVLAEMERSDVFLLPSVTASNGDMEGIPVVLMEAMIRGCVVIASDHSGVSELVERGRSGLLVPERSPEAISAALDRLAAGAFNLSAMREAAQQTVLTRYNNATLDKDLLGIASRLAQAGPDRMGASA